MPNDAWPTLGVIGVMYDPQNTCLQVLLVHCLEKWQNFFLNNINWPSEIICNHFETVKPLLEYRNWVKILLLWPFEQLSGLLLLMRRLKYSTLPGKLWESFTILLPSWWINHTVLNGILANSFQISEQTYAKTEMVGRFDTYESLVDVEYSLELLSNPKDSS